MNHSPPNPDPFNYTTSMGMRFHIFSIFFFLKKGSSSIDCIVEVCMNGLGLALSGFRIPDD